MDRRRASRIAVVAVVATAAHISILFLLGRAVPRPYTLRTSSDDRAVVISLLPRPTLESPPPARPNAAAVRRHLTPVTPSAPPPVLTPAPPAPSAGSTMTPTAPPAAGQAPASPAGPDAAALRLGQALRRHTGCADPDAMGLSAAERAACAERMAQTGGPELGLGIAADKQAAFDRVENCRRYDQAHMPNGLEASNVAGGMAGLGQVPRDRDCPPGGH